MSSKKTVRFSSDLQNINVPYISPSMSPMVLRSRCDGINCTASPTKNLDSNFNFHHHHHNQHHHGQSPISKETLSSSILKKTNEDVNVATSLLMKTVTKSSTITTEEVSSENNRNVIQNGSVNLKALKNTYNLGSSRVNYNGSGDFVFSNKQLVVRVNKLDKNLGSILSDFSSEYLDEGFEERPKTGYTYSQSRSYNSRVTPSRDNNSPNMSRTRIRNKNGDFSSDEETSFLLHGKSQFIHTDVQTSTPMHDRNLLDWDQNIRSQHDFRQTRSYASSSSFLSRVVSFFYHTCFWSVMNVCTKTWMTVWSVIYTVISRILIFDTWALSLLRRNKALMLVPLLLLFLFLWSRGETDEPSTLSTIPSTITSSVFSSVTFLSNWANAKFKDWTIWPIGVQSDASHSSVYQELSSKGAQLDMGKVEVLLKEIVSRESKIMSEKFETQRNNHFQKILTDLQRQTSAFTGNRDRNVEVLQSQSKLLSDELVSVKVAIAKIEEKRLNGDTVAVAEKDFLLLKTKLSNLEAKLDVLQAEIAAQRNCCKNSTFYLQQADRHFVTLLTEIFNVSGGEENFGQLRASLGSLFANQNNLKSRVNQMDSYLKDNLRGIIVKTVKEEAKINVADSINKLRAEIKYNESHKSASSVNIASRNGSSDKCTSADEVHEIIKHALFVYDADKIGQVDFALESSGGSVISTRCAETYHTGSTQYRLFGIPFWYTSNSPRTVIQPEVHPGQCWAFKGTHGYLVIQLAAKIRPTAFTLEHIHKFVSPTGSIDSAPKDFSVYGLKREDDFEGKLLGSFRYEDNNESLQYFIVADPDPGEFSIIELRVNSNHGNNEYTCLYRFRVHGVRV